MEAQAIQIKKRSSRWARDPALDRDRNPLIACLTGRDIEIIRFLFRFRYLPADYIHALVGGDYRSLTHRLNLLSREPNLYLKRPEQQREHAEANHRTLIYELDDRGAQVLRERGVSVPKRKYRRNFAHELMVCQIAASLDIGVQQDMRISIVRWAAIMASSKFPPASRSLANPTAIPFGPQGEIIPDWEPFVISRDLAGERSFIFFPGFEADCGTEPIDPADHDRSSIHAKFRAYLTIIREGIYKTHFGASTFMVLVITTNATRMQSMMALLDRMQPGVHAKRFLFKHIPAFTTYQRTAPPTGHMLNEPWQRVGFDAFRLIE